MLADAHGLATVTDALAEVADGADLVAGIDARGFLLGAAVATRLGTGVLAVRKGGKLPPPVHSETYDLEYGTATLEIPADGIDLAGRSILIIDDVLATGGTVAAAAKLLERGGANVTAAARGARTARRSSGRATSCQAAAGHQPLRGGMCAGISSTSGPTRAGGDGDGRRSALTQTQPMPVVAAGRRAPDRAVPKITHRARRGGSGPGSRGG